MNIFRLLNLVILTCASLTSVIPVFAQNPISKKPFDLKDSYYVGVAAGYDVYKMKDNINYQDFNLNQVSASPDLTLNGMIGDFIFGYGKFLGKHSNIYLGIELFANGSAADTDYQLTIPNIPIIIDTDIVINGSYGAAILPGLKINPATIVYIKLGYNWSTVSLEHTVRSEIDFLPKSVEYHDEKTINGFECGVGMDSAFNEQFSLRIEYTHTNYGSYMVNNLTKISPNRNQLLLGLIYRFTS